MYSEFQYTIDRVLTQVLFSVTKGTCNITIPERKDNYPMD